jgi:predicted membrane metal-binding protein
VIPALDNFNLLIIDFAGHAIDEAMLAATMPYAAFHFHRVTPYGVLANLAAMPVVSAVVMPAGLLGLAAMPFGFDGVFWG